MYIKTAAFAALVAVAHARFNQEQIPIPAIAAVQGGAPGVAQTIAGAAVSDLLAATNACDKLKRGDQILAELGNGTDAIAAAKGIVAAEKNFNPFTQSIPTICSDPTLPANDVLRGITPLIDPAVGGSDIANALSAQTLVTPLDATGQSVADVLVANGFSNFTVQDASGNTGPAPTAGAATTVATISAASASTSTSAAAVAVVTDGCGNIVSSAIATTTTTAVAVVDSTTAAAASTAAVTTAAAAGNGTVQPSTVAGADFGLCVPTMKFEGGLDGRPATEFTFLPIDPLCAEGQEEALNPNIITNRICDQLTNVCESNDAAKTLCRSAQSQIEALGTRDETTADTWNSLLGFAGAVTNPDGGPASPPATTSAATAARMRARAFTA